MATGSPIARKFCPPMPVAKTHGDRGLHCFGHRCVLGPVGVSCHLSARRLSIVSTNQPSVWSLRRDRAGPVPPVYLRRADGKRHGEPRHHLAARRIARRREQGTRAGSPPSRVVEELVAALEVLRLDAAPRARCRLLGDGFHRMLPIVVRHRRVRRGTGIECGRALPTQ